MKVCCYDNPATMAREVWRDGEMIVAYTAQFLAYRCHPARPKIHMGANVGVWQPGRIVGDAEAMSSNMRKAVYTCGHSESFETVVSWPPTKCQQCGKGSLIQGAWLQEIKQRGAV